MAEVLSINEVELVPRGRRRPDVESPLKGLLPGQVVLFDTEFGKPNTVEQRKKVHVQIVSAWKKVGNDSADLSVRWTVDGFPVAVHLGGK